MASAEVHIDIGEQFVEAAKQAVEKAVAPFRGVGEYSIGSDSQDDSAHWPYVVHDPCGAVIWTGQRLGGVQLNLADVLDQVAVHDCEKLRALREVGDGDA